MYCTIYISIHIHRLYVSLFDVSLCRLSVMLSQLHKMSGLIITRLHPVGWVCSRVPCGNRFLPLRVLCHQLLTPYCTWGHCSAYSHLFTNSFFCKQNPCPILRKPATVVLSFVWYHNTVEPPNKGHNRKNLSIKDTFYGPKVLLSYYTNTFLTSEERTTSL